jgi:hypothetical protein
VADLVIAWRAPFEGEDLHLIRGVPAPSVDQLVCFADGTSSYDVPTARNHGLTDIAFRPRLRHGAPAAGMFPALGLQVEAATGRIVADPNPPEPRIEHFHLDIEARIAGQAEPETMSVLVWLHDGIDDVWTTPSPLTFPRGHGPHRSPRTPSILARFDDGVIGDVTNHPGVVLLDGSKSISADPDVAIGATISVDATLPASLLSRPLSVTAVIAPAWEELSTVERTVECLGGAGTAEDADKAGANILILADGLPDPQEQLALARALGVLLRRMRPFSWVSDKVQLWGLGLPSRQTGGTARWMADTADGWPLPVTRPEPPPATGAWEVAHLLHVAGPSVPEPAGGWPSLEDQLDRWSVQLPFSVDELAARVTEETYQRWQRETRLPLNERDTAFGVAQGSRTATYAAPGAREADRYRDLLLRASRVTRAELDRLLGVLVDRNGAPMGDRWTTGRDRGLVVILSGGHAGVANHLPADDVLIVGVEEAGESLLVTSRGDGRGSDVTGAQWPVTRNNAATWQVLKARFTHELAHALGLGDEYGGVHQLPAAELARCATYANLHAEAGTDGLSDGARLRGERMRWNHLRIARAFTLHEGQPIAEVLEDSVDPPHSVDGRVAYRVQVQTGLLEAALNDGFDLNDGSHGTLFLRTRGLPGDPLDAWELSPAVELIEGDVPFDVVWVRERVAGAFAPFRDLVVRTASTTSAPILFAPVPKAIEADGWARLVPKLVRDHVTASGRPLDAPSRADQAVWACPAGGNDSGWPRMRNRPPVRKGRPFFPARRVPAAWTGGMIYDCGVFHPTSHSVMRGSTSRTLESPAGPGDAFIPPGDVDLPRPGEANEFDPVASYLLIDRLDPSRHHELEHYIALRDPD